MASKTRSYKFSSKVVFDFVSLKCLFLIDQDSKTLLVGKSWGYKN